MTGIPGGLPGQHRKGGVCRGQRCVPDTERGLDIELSELEAENTTVKRDYLRQEVEIVMRGVLIVHEVRFMCLFLYLGRILLNGYVSTNLFDLLRHQVDLRSVEDGLELLGKIDLVAGIIRPGVLFLPHLGQRPRFSVCFVVHISLLHEFRTQAIGIGLRLFAGLPE
jgi:hypothetical protein